MNANRSERKRRVTFLVTEDWYFCSHRIGLARFARDAGYEVCVGTRIGSRRAELEAEGFALVDIPFERSLRHPLRDFQAYRAIRRLLSDLQPDIVHLVSLKPILLGGCALNGDRDTPSISAFTGLGYLFSSTAPLARCLKPVVGRLLRRLLSRPGSWILAQNTDDLALLRAHGIDADGRSKLIRGSGVDVDEYRPQPVLEETPPIVLLPARILADKGVNEFVEAARVLRERGVAARFVLAGAHDPDNPGAVDRASLKRWLDEGVVEWWGHCRNMPEVYARSALVCLPSYREGLPRCLLEGAACARPLIATDVPGCREICVDRQTGLVVPVRDAPALSQAIEKLLADPELRRRYAQNARDLVARDFSLERVARETLEFYDEILDATFSNASRSG